MSSNDTYSKDILAKIFTDKIGEEHFVKRKIAWGSDGTYEDVSTLTPFPVQIIGSSTGGAWANFGQSTPKQVTVTNISTQVLAANSSRLYALITNNSSQVIYLQYNIDAVFQQGRRLNPGASWEINLQSLYTGSINAITNIGSVEIDVMEGMP